MISSKFHSEVLSYYQSYGRHTLPWRTNLDPYAILVSEVMLQQTQVTRVIPKFTAFLTQFPTVESLAAAPLSQVLTLWSGLGYNRRAKFLHTAAQQLSSLHHSHIPADPAVLAQLPGIGLNTAKAICVYAYNQPHVFIETNIRSVFLHHYFPTQTSIADNQLIPLIEQQLDRDNPREWYWSLMDYGTYLKTQLPNPNRRSHHYTKQSKFAGSNRQVRGHILRILTTSPLSLTELTSQLQVSSTTTMQIIQQLLSEGLIEQHGAVISLPGPVQPR